mgnify:FL=1
MTEQEGSIWIRRPLWSDIPPVQVRHFSEAIPTAIRFGYRLPCGSIPAAISGPDRRSELGRGQPIQMFPPQRGPFRKESMVTSAFSWAMPAWLLHPAISHVLQ